MVPPISPPMILLAVVLSIMIVAGVDCWHALIMSVKPGDKEIDASGKLFCQMFKQQTNHTGIRVV